MRRRSCFDCLLKYGVLLRSVTVTEKYLMCHRLGSHSIPRNCTATANDSGQTDRQTDRGTSATAAAVLPVAGNSFLILGNVVLII